MAAQDFIFNTEATAANFRFGAVTTFTAPDPTGGGVSGGTGGKARVYARTASGGAVSGGAGSTLRQGVSSTFFYDGDGGGIASGTAGKARTRARTASGGAVSGGTARIGHVWARTGAGGGVAGGAAATIGPSSAFKFNFLSAGLATSFVFAGLTTAFMRPSSDVAAGQWLTQAGSGTGLFSAIDEVSPDDSDFIRSPVGPVAAAAKVRLSAPAVTPSVDTGHRLHLRYGKHGGKTINLTARLKQGATTIWEKTYFAINEGGLTVVEDLTASEAANITNYGLVDVEWVVTELQDAPRPPFQYQGSGIAVTSGAATIGHIWARTGSGGGVSGGLATTLLIPFITLSDIIDDLGNTVVDDLGNTLTDS